MIRCRQRMAGAVIVAAAGLGISMLSLAAAAQSRTRSFQMSILASTDGVYNTPVDMPIFTRNAYSLYQPQPAGRSVAWLPPDPNLDRHNIDWSRIVAVYVDEPYNEVLQGRNSCAAVQSAIAEKNATLEAMATELRARAPWARFWVNFTKHDIDLMLDPATGCALNQPYIDVISMDIYGVPFYPTLSTRYDNLYLHRATSHQQLALIPGTFTLGYEKQSARQGAARLSGYFGYAARRNQQCDLPLGPRGTTGFYDGCPVWMIAGWTGGVTPLDYEPRDYVPLENPASARVLREWQKHFELPRVDPSRTRRVRAVTPLLSTE